LYKKFINFIILKKLNRKQIGEYAGGYKNVGGLWFDKNCITLTNLNFCIKI